MPATPARIALSLQDGVVLSKLDATIKANHPNAKGENDEIESFFDLQADAQVLLDERWNWQSSTGRPREQIEIDSSFGLGVLFNVAPNVPNINVTDDPRGILGDDLLVRAYSIDYSSERYAVELAG